MLASWCEELTHLKRPWCWEWLKVGGEGEDREDRGRDGWTAPATQWTWVWVSPGSWWWTGRPGVLQSMALLWVRHDWATELNWSGFPWCPTCRQQIIGFILHNHVSQSLIISLFLNIYLPVCLSISLSSPPSSVSLRTLIQYETE